MTLLSFTGEFVRIDSPDNKRFKHLLKLKQDSKYRQEAQKILLVDDVVIMPLFFTSHQALIRESLSGVSLNALDRWYFKNFSWNENKVRFVFLTLSLVLLLLLHYTALPLIILLYVLLSVLTNKVINRS